jgi:hypothetical protein
LFHSSCTNHHTFQFLTLRVDQIKTAHDRWCDANARSNTRKQQEREKTEREQEVVEIDQDADLTDINALFSEHGQGPHLLELEFELTTENPIEYTSKITGNLTKCWTWCHKMTKVEVKRYRTQSLKSYDTGGLSSNLKKITERQNRQAFQRAQHILKLNSKNGRKVDVPGQTVVVDRETLVKQWVSLIVSFCLYSSIVIL